MGLLSSLDRAVLSEPEFEQWLATHRQPSVRRFKRFPASGYLTNLSIDVRPPAGWIWEPEYATWVVQSMVADCRLQVEVVNTHVEDQTGYYIAGLVDANVHYIHFSPGTGYGAWDISAGGGQGILSPFPLYKMDHSNYLTFSPTAAGDRYHWVGLFYREYRED